MVSLPNRLSTLFSQDRAIQFGARRIPVELALFVLVGSVLRVYRVGSESLWIDEVFMTTMATDRTLSELLFVVPTFEPHPPLYNVFVWFWVRLTGVSAVTMRSTSVVLGVIAIVLCYRLGRRMFDRWTAAVATLFVTVSPFQIWYAQEARMYALLLVTTLASYLLLVQLRESYTRRRAVLYVSLGVVVGYTHVYGLFVLLAQGVTAVWATARRSESNGFSLRQLGVLFGVPFLAISPWTGLLAARTVAPELFPADAAAWLQAPSGLELMDAFRLLTFGATQFTRPYRTLSAPSDVFLFPASFCLLLVAGFYTMGVFSDHTRGIRLLGVWFAATVGLPILLSVTVRPIFQLRYLIVASPAFFLLLARGSKAVSIPAVRYVLVVLLVVGMVAPLPGYYAEPNKDQWEAAANDVSSVADADDVVLVVPGWTWNGPSDAFRFYFDRPNASVEPLYSFSPPGSFESAVANHTDVYLVVSYTNERTAVTNRVANATGSEPTNRTEYVSIVVVSFESTQGPQNTSSPTL